MPITDTILKDSAEHAELAESHAEDLRQIKRSLLTQLNAVEVKLCKAEDNAKGLKVLHSTQQEAFDKQTDKAVENQSRFEAMKDNPQEFTADEIIAELDAPNLHEMTSEMAEIITYMYPGPVQTRLPRPFLAVIVAHAHTF